MLSSGGFSTVGSPPLYFPLSVLCNGTGVPLSGSGTITLANLRHRRAGVPRIIAWVGSVASYSRRETNKRCRLREAVPPGACTDFQSLHIRINRRNARNACPALRTTTKEAYWGWRNFYRASPSSATVFAPPQYEHRQSGEQKDQRHTWYHNI